MSDHALLLEIRDLLRELVAARRAPRRRHDPPTVPISSIDPAVEREALARLARAGVYLCPATRPAPAQVRAGLDVSDTR